MIGLKPLDYQLILFSQNHLLRQLTLQMRSFSVQKNTTFCGSSYILHELIKVYGC